MSVGDYWLETLEVVCWISIIVGVVGGGVVLSFFPNVDLHDSVSWVVLFFGIFVILTIGLRQRNRQYRHRSNASRYCENGACKTSPLDVGLERWWRLTTKSMDDALKGEFNHNGVLEPDAFNRSVDTCKNKHYESDPACYVIPPQPLKNMYRLALHNYYLRSSFNTCAVSSSLTNTIVDLAPLTMAIRTGFRFLDFEVCAKRGEPAVALFDNRTTITRKSSYNDLPLEKVLKTIVDEGLKQNDGVNHRDPLIVHLRIRTKITDILNKIARAIRRYLSPYLMRAHELYVLGKYENDAGDKERHSPFNVPIEHLVHNAIVVLYDGSQLDAFKGQTPTFRSFVEQSELGVLRRNGSFEPLYHAWSKTYDADAGHGHGDLNIIHNNASSSVNPCKQTAEDERVDRMYMLCPPLYDHELNKGESGDPCKTCSENDEAQKYDALVATINDGVEAMVKPAEGAIFRPNIVPVQLQALVKKEMLLGEYNRFFTSHETGTQSRDPGVVDLPNASKSNRVRVSFKQKVFKTTRYEYQAPSFSTKNSYGRHSVKSSETIMKLEGRV